MDFDDLQRQWAAQDARLDPSLRIEARLLRDLVADRARRPLRGLTAGVAVEVGVGAVALLALGGYLAARFGEPRFLIPALALHLAAIAHVGFGVHQLVAIRGIDHAAPLLAVQRRLETLRRRRIRATMWTVVTAPLLWTPLLIVGLDGLLGVDAYAVLDPVWLAGNLAVGIAAIPLLRWAARRLARRFAGRPWMQGLLDDVGGRSLREAGEFLADLDRLERGPGAA